MDKIKTKLLEASLRILRPLARTLIRHGVSHAEFSEVARQAFVDVGFRDFILEGKKQTVSRVSVLTGLSRKEVQRLRDAHDTADLRIRKPINRAQRVINGWMSDPELVDPRGEALALPMYGQRGSFSALVKRHAGDVKPGAVLDELIRQDIVERSNGTVYLKKDGYVPLRDTQEKIDIMGVCASDLLETLDYNSANENELRYQRALVYHDIPPEVITQFKQHSARKSQRLLNELNQWLALKKKATAGYSHEERKRIGVGIYFFENRDEELG